MKVFIAKIYFPYDDNYTIVGVFSSELKAQEEIEKRIEHYQSITNKDYRPMTDIDEYTLDNVINK